MGSDGIIQFIAAKRDGQEHSAAELAAFVEGLVRGQVRDYQASAWLMAAFLRGLTGPEVTGLTQAMAASGHQYAVGHFGSRSVDKHSTGGVGDKTSLVVVPLCASLGAVVPKMAGRSLGFTGGTIDKLESIPGFRTQLELAAFEKVVRRVGCAIMSQSAEFAPADGILYALRDATATVESPALIAASIMSKKLALGCPAIVIDLKVGTGAFCKTTEEASVLGQLIKGTAKAAGRRLSIVYSSMEQPLGHAVGHSLEVLEAIDTLQGQGPEDFVQHCLTVATEMMLAARLAENASAAEAACAEALRSGQAYVKFLEMVEAQGGDPRAVELKRLPVADIVRPISAPSEGFVSSLNARRVAEALGSLGAARQWKGQPIDLAVGIVLVAKVGAYVSSGDELARIYARTEEAAARAAAIVLSAYTLGPEPVPVANEHPLHVERL